MQVKDIDLYGSVCSLFSPDFKIGMVVDHVFGKMLIRGDIFSDSAFRCVMNN